MEARKISVKLRRDPRETAERHSQANPLTLECTLATGESVTETMELRAELHAAQTPATSPLAATATVNMTSGSTGPWELEFSGAQMNQTVLPDSSTDFWLVVYATNAADDLFTLGKIALTLTFDNVSQVTPAPPDPALFLDLGGTKWKAAESYLIDDVVALSGSIYVCTANNTSSTTNRPGSGASWTSFWTLFSGGGGGGSVTLTGDVTGTGTGTVATTIADGAVTSSKIATGAVGATQLASTAVTPGNYTLLNATIDSDGRITAASNGTAGTVTAVSVATANGVSGTSSGGATPALTITLGAITPSSVNGVTLTNGGSGALTVTGTASVAGTTSGTNTGNVTLAASLTDILELSGQQLRGFTDPLADQILFFDQSASKYTFLTVGTGLSISGTTISATSTGDVTGPASSTANAIARFSLTGGKTLLNSAIVIDDIDAATQQNVAIRNVDPATNSAVVITPKGTGAFIVGPKPDGTNAGGNARGTDAVDFQRSRNAITQVAGAPGSFIAGGARNTTSGGAGQEYSFIGAGFNNIASGYSSAAFGAAVTASGSRSFAAGQSSTASGIVSAAFGASTASATYSFSLGFNSLANRIGMMAHANGQFSTVGDAQRGSVVMRRQTTDATPTNLSFDGAAPTGSTITSSTHFILLNNQTCMVEVAIVARSAAGADVAGFRRNVVVSRNANAASTTITGLQVVGVDIKSAGATLWDATLAADTTNGGLLVTVTGAAATNINWTAEVRVVETIRA